MYERPRSGPSIGFEWFILGLRIAFIALIYLFLYQVARISMRELVAFSAGTGQSDVTALPSASSSFEVVDAAESSLQPGDVLPLSHYMTVGRRDDNTLQLDDSFVSGSHAEVIFDQGAWWLVDLGSTNGTFVNRRAIHVRTRLANGDVVQFGHLALRAHL